MTDNAPDLPPLYDIEAALVAVEEARGRQDEITAEVIRISDKLAPNIARHFAPDQLETAGLAMALAAASLPVLAAGNDLARAMCTVMGFAGQRMVAEARAAAAVPVNACETDADAARRFAGQNIELQASVTHLNNDLDTLLWLHAEASWLMTRASDAYFDGRRRTEARIAEALKLVDDLGECIDYPGDWAGAPLSQRLRAALVNEDDQAQPGASTDPADWQCGKCEGANVPEHFRLCPKRAETGEPDVPLLTTREDRAAMFDAVLTGASRQFLEMLDKALAAEQIDDATTRRLINRMIYGNPTPEDEVPGA